MKVIKHYCGLQWISFRDLIVAKNKNQSWFINKDRYIVYTHKGRCGLGLLCEKWKLKFGSEILMPSYNCGTEIDPFIHYGLNVVFYRVDQNASIDLKDLLSRVTERTRIVYVIHYFGWPQKINELSEYCKSNSIYLIEDCALSLFSYPLEYPIGFLGDAAIYSLPKTLPVPDGGALLISDNSTYFDYKVESPPLSEILKNMLPFVKRWIFQFSDIFGLYHFLPDLIRGNKNSANSEVLLTPAGLPEMPESYYYDVSIQNMKASAITRFLINHTSSESISDRRRMNYERLLILIGESDNFKILHKNLPAGVCPLYFVVIVKNSDEVSAKLNEMGIVSIKWWSGFHKAFDWRDFPEACNLKQNVLVLPIHQQLTKKNIDYIADIFLSITNQL
jgi:dTDP-4-amino-4,6-dideoxygalactose transaminase